MEFSVDRDDRGSADLWNGHMARTIVLLLLGRSNIYPRQAWTIEPRPADPPYTNLISRYRSGDQDPLVQFIVKAL